MGAALFIVPWLASLLLLTVQQVSIIPSGVVLIPQNTEARIFCNVTNELQFSRWALLKDNVETAVIPRSSIYIDGIKITEAHLSYSILLLNTTIIQGEFILKCYGIMHNLDNTFNTSQQTLNVTVYGVPDRPINISISNMGNLLSLSWCSPIMENIPQTYNFSLTLFYPSKLKNISTVVNETHLRLNLVGMRSCDRFRVCIGTRNIVGQGELLCVEDELSFVPSQSEINFNLERKESGISLHVKVFMPSECFSNDLDYELKVSRDEENFTYTSTLSHASAETVLEMNRLSTESNYSFQIISYNNLGNGESESLYFSTGGVIGIIMCQTTILNEYNVKCLYMSDILGGDCNFKLIGKNSYDILEIFDVGDDYQITRIPNIYSYQRILVYDENYVLVGAMKFNSSNLLSCYSSETETNFPVTSEVKKETSTNKIVAIVLITVIAAIIVIIISLILLYLIVCRNTVVSFSPTKENESTFDKNSRDVDTNQSYGVRSQHEVRPQHEVRSHEDNAQYNPNPSYEAMSEGNL